jgi:type II secretory pathway component PulF
LSLKTISDGSINKNLKDIIGQVVRDIEAGANLSSALSKYPVVFRPLYVNMIKVAEASGTLEQALQRLTTLGEYEEKFRSRIKAATRYPIIVVIAIVIGFLILTTLVVPRFAKIYSQFTTALPLPTQILIWLNLAMMRYWWALIITAGICIFVFKKFINTEKGRVLWDNFKLKIPVFGPLELKLIMSRFTRIMGTLMKSGVDLFQVLDLSSDGVGNVIVLRTIGNIKKSVSEGKGLSEPMKLSGIFPPIVVQMVSVGEQTGKLDELLLHVSNYYDAQAEYTVSNLTSLIEPVLILVLGCAVLFMALGIFLPMWSLMNLFKR